MLRSLFAVPVLILASVALAAEPVKPTAPPEPPDMVKLFNGKDLTGWEGDPRLWSVKDGAIRGQTTADKQTKGNTFLIYVGNAGKPVEFKDFELRLSFRIDHGNAGVQYRSVLLPAPPDAENKWVVAGYQAEVANSPTAAGFLYHERARASLVQVGDKVVINEDGSKQVVGKLGDRNEIAKHYKMSDWNDYVIICKANHIQHFLNGVQTIDLIDNDIEPSVDKNGKPEPLKCRSLSGIIALQIHAGPPMWVDYKDIRIKTLD